MSSRRPTHFHPDDSFYAFTVKRPVAILMVVLAVVVFGAVSYQRLALTLMPDMSYPTLTVRTMFPGTAPEEMENIVSRPLEQQLGITPKLVSISSISKAGQSDVILEFQWKTDMNAVAQEVREKIDRLRLPEGAQRPLLLHYDPSMDPILRLGLAGPQSLYELRYMADNEIKRKLEALPGVAAIQVKGGLEEQFLVAIDESKLATLRLDITQVGQRLSAGNVNLSGGNLREGQTEYVIRTLNEFRTIEEIGALIISRQGTVDIRLRDIATITRYHKDREVITRVNGEESVEIEIFKEADANIVIVAETVRTAIFGTAEQKAYVAGLQKGAAAKAAKGKVKSKVKPGAGGRSGGSGSMKSFLGGRAPLIGSTSATDPMQMIKHRQMTEFLAYQLPPGAKLELLADQSVFISKSIDEVKGNAISGALIAVVVLYLFLRNVGQTIIIALGIPISIVATFAPMYMADVSLNIISLGGLALGVGMLVDNGIVVLESIFRCREEGDDMLTAVVRGTQEVGMAVVASTLTTVAVFFPIVFVEGVAGQLFGDMALTVVFSLLASLATALFLIPMLASRRFGEVAQAAGQSRLRSSEFLQFPAHQGSRLLYGVVVVGIILARTALALAAVAAAIVKSAVALLVVALWPVWAAGQVVWQRWIRRLPPGTASARPAGWWSRLAGWEAADALGPVQGPRVWPGVLSFAGVEHLGRAYTALWQWFTARRWRWIVAWVFPAIVTLFVLGVRHTTWLNAVGPEELRRFMRVQSWWWAYQPMVPGLIGFAFSLLRFISAVALRLAGTVLLSVALVLALAGFGLARALTVLAWPFTGPGLNWFENGYQRMQNAYPRLIAGALRHRAAVLGGSVLAFLVCWFVIVPRIGRELIPQVHQGEFNLDITLPIGTPLERTAEVAAEIDEYVWDQPEVERTSLVVGAQEGATTSIQAGEHTARLTVKMAADMLASDETVLIDRIREVFHDMPEVEIEVSYPALFSFRSPIEVEIRGHDLEGLKRVSREAEQLLAESVPGLVDVRSTLQAGHPEIQIIYNRDRLAEYGLALRNVADLVRNKVQGRIATQFRKDDQLIDIVVRLREEDRLGIEELRGLIVNPNSPVAIPLSAVADLTINEGPSEIRRIDQQRAALITANIHDADLATVSAGIVAVLSDMRMPAGFSFNIAGQNKEMKTSLNSLLLAFGLALFLVYIVMASQFESLVQPLLIMMTVPLALIGVAVVLWAASIPISIMVFLGLIILAGIVVNNAIVLIDYINTLRGRGLELTHAIAEAGRARLRPILMTTLTTVLGLLPMALGLGEGAEIRAPMAITVIIGLTSSTVLTLVVIPTLYYQFAGRRGPTRIEKEPIDDDVRVEEPVAQAAPQPMAK